MSRQQKKSLLVARQCMLTAPNSISQLLHSVLSLSLSVVFLSLSLFFFSPPPGNSILYFTHSVVPTKTEENTANITYK